MPFQEFSPPVEKSPAVLSLIGIYEPGKAFADPQFHEQLAKIMHPETVSVSAPGRPFADPQFHAQLAEAIHPVPDAAIGELSPWLAVKQDADGDWIGSVRTLPVPASSQSEAVIAMPKQVPDSFSFSPKFNPNQLSPDTLFYGLFAELQSYPNLARWGKSAQNAVENRLFLTELPPSDQAVWGGFSLNKKLNPFYKPPSSKIKFSFDPGALWNKLTHHDQ